MFLIALAAGTALMMQSAGAEIAKAEQARLEACVAKIETDPDNAYEDALALIELGNYETGADRLVALANSTDGGTLEQRAIYLSQAGQAWIMAGAPEKAVLAFSDALKLAPGTVELLVDRASAHMMTEDWDKALSDLDLALANSPGFGPAHQLRAEVHLNKHSYDLAMRDVEAAMAADPKNIDTLLVRGRVREAMRVEADSGVATPLD
jgi:tetratricopeptide (TPR) repeat protein